MKARTKAAKRRVHKGGRPRTEGAPREASGKIDRNWSKQTQSDDAMETAVNTRIRLFGLTKEQARSQEGGTVIGRLYFTGELAPQPKQAYDLLRAAERYYEVHNAYSRAMGAAPETGTPPPPGIFDGGGGTYEDFCAGAIEARKQAVACIQTVVAQQRSYGPATAVDLFVIKDQYVPHLLGDLRIALNALHRHFTQERRRA